MGAYSKYAIEMNVNIAQIECLLTVQMGIFYKLRNRCNKSIVQRQGPNKTLNSISKVCKATTGEIGLSDGGVGARLKPSAVKKLFMVEKLSNGIRKRTNRSTTSSGDETSPLHEDSAGTAGREHKLRLRSKRRNHGGFCKIEEFGEQLNAIIARLSKLDIIESSVRNTESNLANLKARTAKLEEFEVTAKNDITELKSCSFNGDKSKEHRDVLRKQMEEQNKKK